MNKQWFNFTCFKQRTKFYNHVLLNFFCKYFIQISKIVPLLSIQETDIKSFILNDQNSLLQIAILEQKLHWLIIRKNKIENAF